MCSTPKTPKDNSKTNESPASSCSKVDTSNCSINGDNGNVLQTSCSPNDEHSGEIVPEESNGSSPEEVNDLGKFQAIKNHQAIFLLCSLFTCFGCLVDILLA